MAKDGAKKSAQRQLHQAIPIRRSPRGHSAGEGTHDGGAAPSSVGGLAPCSAPAGDAAPVVSPAAPRLGRYSCPRGGSMLLWLETHTPEKREREAKQGTGARPRELENHYRAAPGAR